jgi:nucleoid-associated protein YgaU
MSFLSIAGTGAAKTMIAVTVSLHPGAAHHATQHTTVRAGDSLSSISQREFGSSASWPALWWANRHNVHNPSVIQAGERLVVPGSHKVKPWLTHAALAAIPAAAPAPVAAPAAPSASTGAVTSAAPAQQASYSGSGGFQSCVIQRESGGDASAVNGSSGAGGLYGFLPSTWQALGHSGLPENASVAEQNAAFAQEYAQSGGSAWSAYDGC